jgi:SSS family solute:Na+ symporter
VVILGLKEIGWIDGLKIGLHTVGENSDKLGLSSLKALGTDAWTSIWSNMGSASQNAMGIDWFGMVFGLGFVLSFGYWCTNFLVVQRAMAANSMSAARRTPLIAAVPKIIFPILVIAPGLIAISLHSNSLKPDGKGFLPGSEVAQVRTVGWDKLEPAFIASKPLMDAAVAKVSTSEAMVAKREASETVLRLFKTALATTNKDGKTVAPKLNETAVLNVVYAYNTGQLGADPAQASAIAINRLNWAGEVDYNNVITVLLKRYCPVGLLGLALTALLASFMSGMAGNVTAFNTVWTYDIYQPYFAPNKSDAHYMKVGRLATVAGIIISIGCAFVAKQFNNIMDVAQLVFGFVNAPLFATFLWGMFSKRVTGHGAFWGLLIGTTTSALFHLTTITGTESASFIKGGFVELYRFQSDMAKNFWLAIFAFTAAFVSTYVISLATKQKKTDAELVGLVYSLTPKQPVDANEAWFMRPAVAGSMLLLVTLILNILFW